MNERVSFHPQDDLLIEFSNGSLAAAPSMCVSAHLHFCERCRARVNQLNELGSGLFEQSQRENTSEGLLDVIFSKIDGQTTAPKATQVAHPNNYPHVVEKLLADKRHPLKWRNLSSSLKVARLFTGQNLFEVSLHRIKAGGKTPHHNHSGKEFTVVLSGSFSDEHGVYREGDFILKQQGDTHHPVGAKNGDCICFTALESPIRIKGLLGWLLKPFLQVHPI